ncbi:hypothetical protein [Pseudomonas caspiana]|uniref:hypothetical protein n=1 Tax=Pseudomonas caspiana TaxID=1451454 RepID=UPI0032EB19B7
MVNQKMENTTKTKKTWRGAFACFLFLFAASSTLVYAETPLSDESHKESGLRTTNINPLEAFSFIQEVINARLTREDRSMSSLEENLRVQTEKIKTLENEILILKNQDSSITATTVLAAVSVIITVLGVLIAILSIFGYTNIKNEAIKDARETAIETVKAIAKEDLPKLTELNIVALIAADKFDKLIQNAVENVVYRGIEMPNDTSQEGGES